MPSTKSTGPGSRLEAAIARLHLRLLVMILQVGWGAASDLPGFFLGPAVIIKHGPNFFGLAWFERVRL